MNGCSSGTSGGSVVLLHLHLGPEKFISDFWPPELQENKFMLFKPPSLWYFVRAAARICNSAKHYSKVTVLLCIPTNILFLFQLFCILTSTWYCFCVIVICLLLILFIQVQVFWYFIVSFVNCFIEVSLT